MPQWCHPEWAGGGVAQNTLEKLHLRTAFPFGSLYKGYEHHGGKSDP